MQEILLSAISAALVTAAKKLAKIIAKTLHKI